MPKRRHHILPKFYLRSWESLGPKKVIWTYDQVNGRVWAATVNNTAVERDAYSLVTHEGMRDPDTLEELIGKIESASAIAYRKLKNGDALTDQERANFSGLVALIYLRSPAHLRQTAEIAYAQIKMLSHATASHDEAFKQSMEGYEATHGPMSDKEKEQLREDLLDPSRFRFSIAREFLNTMMLYPFDRLHKIIDRMKWTLLVSETEEFITGDSPVGRFLPKKFRKPLLGWGFGVLGIEATLPLSPRMCWLGTWDEGAQDAMVVPKKSVRELNRFRAIDAEQYLYVTKQDPGITKLAAKYKGPGHKLAPTGFGFDGKPLDVDQHMTETNGLGRVDLKSKREDDGD